MNDAYFAAARREVLPHLPPRVARLMDVGCGAGATTAMIREAHDVQFAAGIELLPGVAERARPHFDRLWTGDALSAPIEEAVARGALDLILCLDVLEHMADPWALVRRLSPLLAPGGRLIVSVPNIRHIRFIWRLFAHGDFRYRDSGLLDRTHLRFFVRETAVELATAGGLRLVAVLPAQTWRPFSWRWLAARLTGGRSDELHAKQWLVVAEQPIPPRVTP